MKTPKPTEDSHKCYGIRAFGMILIYGELILITTGQRGESCFHISWIPNFNATLANCGDFFAIKNFYMIKHLQRNKYVKITLRITGILIAIIFLLLTIVAIYIESHKALII